MEQKEPTKARAFCFTRFDMDFEPEEIPQLRYVCMGRETCPTTGTEHWQGWAVFNHPIRRALAARRLGCAFDATQIMRGTVEDNDMYCKKDGDVVEWGDRPAVTQGRPRSDLATYLDGMEQGMTELQLYDEWPTTAVVFGRRVEELRRMREVGARELIGRRRTWKTEVRVWWGHRSGTGKTRAAIDWLTEEEGSTYDDVQQSGNFVIGYTNNANVLLDDFEGHIMQRNLFLRMADRYQMTINVKYKDGVQWNPRKLAITSNTNPQSWYTQPDAVMRRIDVVTHMP